MIAMLDRLIRQMEQRGLSIKPGAETGQLVLSGPSAEKTPEIMAAVKAFKPQLLERFGEKAKPDLPSEPREDVVIADPKPQAPSMAYRSMGLTTAGPHHCGECNAIICATPGEVTMAFCESPSCPYRTGTTSSRGRRAS